jgi:hypothetical protein
MSTNNGNYQFRKIGGFFICMNDSNGMFLSSPKTKWEIVKDVSVLIKKEEYEEVKNHELRKLWPHRTRFSRRDVLNGQSVEHLLTEELMKRGYCLGIDKKWVPQNAKAL